MKADEKSSEKIEPKLTPEEEIASLVAGRASELAIRGDSKGAAAILIAYQKGKLPDNHPIKNLENFQVLEKEQVEMLADFERQAQQLNGAASFLTAIGIGGINPNNMTDNAMMLGDFLRDEHPDLLQEAAEYLIRRKLIRDIGQKYSTQEIQNKEVPN